MLNVIAGSKASYFKESMKKITDRFRRNLGQVCYYGCLLAALSAIAFAAEAYRRDYAEKEIQTIQVQVPSYQNDAAEEMPMQLPEGAGILAGFTSLPQWNGELEFWQCHEAVDFACSEVHALSGGVVQAVGKSGISGGFVEILSGEYLFRYASIEPVPGLKAGEDIERGNAIGRADLSMVSEAHMGPHLHLEVYQNEMPVDFEALVGKNRA